MSDPQSPSRNPRGLSKSLPPDRRRSGRGVFAKAVGSFVPKLTAKAFERFGFHSAEIMADWSRIVGSDIAAMATPERIKWPRQAPIEGEDGGSRAGARLVLRVQPARALDIEYRSGEIMDRINRYFGYRAIGEIRLVQAPLMAHPKEKSALGPLVAAPSAVTPSDPAPVADGGDEALNAALTRLWGSIGAERQIRDQKRRQNRSSGK